MEKTNYFRVRLKNVGLVNEPRWYAPIARTPIPRQWLENILVVKTIEGRVDVYEVFGFHSPIENSILIQLAPNMYLVQASECYEVD